MQNEVILQNIRAGILGGSRACFEGRDYGSTARRAARSAAAQPLRRPRSGFIPTPSRVRGTAGAPAVDRVSGRKSKVPSRGVYSVLILRRDLSAHLVSRAERAADEPDAAPPRTCHFLVSCITLSYVRSQDPLYSYSGTIEYNTLALFPGYLYRTRATRSVARSFKPTHLLTYGFGHG
ncbi:hypothetical protein BD626DRAFT_48137 [Schizophyllum amplum]|uniref:Uncharacterized protein n=1 Tax=Schizophyllum amplum TaxID=97359 RepID=A0A550BSQ4_9AGAR|nr:hypothetical protein BD626DRAFT_48137 [Auriculariopsis ampla]